MKFGSPAGLQGRPSVWHGTSAQKRPPIATLYFNRGQFHIPARFSVPPAPSDQFSFASAERKPRTERFQVVASSIRQGVQNSSEHRFM
jgi:hypothetical protein